MSYQRAWFFGAWNNFSIKKIRDLHFYYSGFIIITYYLYLFSAHIIEYDQLDFCDTFLSDFINEIEYHNKQNK